MKAPFTAAIAVLGFVMAGLSATVALATPLQECESTSTQIACLDAKLKAVNQKLNATLKAAQTRLEQLQASGRRPVLGAFIDSQRKFNAYRDAQCNWQGVRAPSSANASAYVKDCQIRSTIAREQELAEFVAGDETPATDAPSPTKEPDAQGAKFPDPAPQSAVELPAGNQPVIAQRVVPEPALVPADKSIMAPEEKSAAAQSDKPLIESVATSSVPRSNEWRLVKWLSSGVEKTIAPDSPVTIAFDPSGKVSGNASVNRFTGTYRFDEDGRLRWPPAGFALTRMAGSPALMSQERAFLTSLKRTSTYKVDGQQLVLQSPNASIVLTFAR
ncbi:MAG: META domain-containing protein [Betaproteobacteria bacterium]